MEFISRKETRPEQCFLRLQQKTDGPWRNFWDILPGRKQGIGWDGWKDAEIYIYEGIVLDE